MNLDRVRRLNPGSRVDGPVVYWMSRDQRCWDNWALVHAQRQAIAREVPLGVLFSLVPEFLGATERHYSFMIHGLREVESRLAKLNVPFYLLEGSPEMTVPEFVMEHGVSYLVTDFDPLRLKGSWKKKVCALLDTPMVEVDTHNIVPCWVLSGKQEYAAYTIRSKVRRSLPTFLDEFEQCVEHPFHWGEEHINDWVGAMKRLNPDTSVEPVEWIRPGQQASLEALGTFLKTGLEAYPENRNDPNIGGQSNLSPYLHFGQLSAQRVALEVRASASTVDSKEAFLEELTVRKELSDNFCFYNPHYDSVGGFPSWARRTLHDHLGDRREYLYDLDELEMARTHDMLWNAAQSEMVTRGKMHGYMRMYWAKKILEWTESPQKAMEFSIHLNDRYELDGRDPNGYTGIAWSIGGVHDRPWNERSVFGKVRYMSLSGARRKFDVDAYIREHLGDQ